MGLSPRKGADWGEIRVKKSSLPKTERQDQQHTGELIRKERELLRPNERKGIFGAYCPQGERHAGGIFLGEVQKMGGVVLLLLR